MKNSFVMTLVIILSGLLLHGCKKDTGDPPVVPSAWTMDIDFSNFESGKKGEASVSMPKGTNNSNWEFVAGVAVIWKTIIYTTFAVPVTTFSKAVGQKAVYIENQTWEWNYSATVLNATYNARLTGQNTSSGVVWKMYITREGEGGYSDFLWFEGTSERDGTGGQWKMNLSPQSPVPVLQIDWERTGENTGMVKYTYVKSGDSFKDSYIEYGLTTGALNAYYEISYFNSLYQQVYYLNVEWSTSLHNGRVKCPVHFGTDQWYCWDGNFLNVDCP
jgi:hypothetical protein